MKQKIGALLAALALAVSAAACGAPGASVTPTPVPAATPAPTPAPEQIVRPETQPAFPATVTDAAGRQVSIESQPETLVSGYYITTSMLIAMGQQDKLVGIEAKAASRPIYALAAPELLELPNVGSAKEFDLEGCAALEPDLAILPLRLKDAADTLTELGIPTITVNPEDLEQMAQTVRLLGQAIGAVEEAQALLDDNQATQDFLEQTLAGAAAPRVYLAGNSSYLSTAGGAMYQNALIELGGGENVAAGLTDTYWAQVSYEQLLSWDPEVILIACDAGYTREELLGDPQLEQLSAVRSGAVYAMPSGVEAWDSPVPSALVGSRWVASVLHGDAYPFGQFQADAAEFYRNFYGFEIDPALLPDPLAW